MAVGYRTLIIAVLVIGILLGLVFGVGAVYGSKTVKAPTQVAAAGGGGGGASAGTSALSSGGGSAGGSAQNAPFAGQTVGSVTAVQGDTVTMRATNGQALTFSDTPTTPVTNSVSATVNDIRQGELVLVIPGPPDAQGRTRANSVTILPAALAGALASGAGGAGGGGAPGAGAPPASP